MAGAKETPRQKMISMMYLVLTALLALNVSVEVIDSFNNVNKGIETSISSIERKLDDYYMTFEMQYEKDKAKTAHLWNKAQEIRVKTDELINYIETEVKLQLLLENNVITKEQAFNPEKKDDIVILHPEKADPSKNRRIYHELNFENLKSKDKHDAVTSMMITYGKASELKAKIEEYRQYIINTIEAQTNMDYDSHIGLRTDEKYYDASGVEIGWEEQHFNHIIPPAAFAIINNIIAEVQTAEFDAVAVLFKTIGASDYKFNKLEAKVFPKTTYVLSGQDYEAQIYIAGTDTERKFDAKFAKGISDFSKANSNAIQTISSVNGVVTIKIPTKQEGEQNFAGIIEMKDPETGEIVPYPFHSSFTVAPPSATVSPTKMNVMYRGLENPISISAPGMTNENIQVDITNGTINKGTKAGEYLVMPGKDNITTITATTTIDGKKIVLGNYDFRIKRVPAPTPKIGGKTSGLFSKQELLAAGGLMVPLEDFDFEGYKYTIVSYDFMTVVGGNLKRGTANGSKFNSDVNSYINALGRGQTLNFTNIRVKGSDGEERLLDSPIVVEIK